MRKLATIRRIDAINPIPNADAIEVATVGGWNVVVKKGQFALNELALFLEIDSWVPHEIAPFLCKSKEPREYLGVKGERLKTVRLRGQLSQGLLLPLKEVWTKLVDTTVHMRPVDWDSFIAIVNDKWNAFEEFRDVDYSEQLGIIKWEPQIPAQLAGLMKGNFPSFIQKTDQERIQNIKRQFEDIAAASDELFEITEKLDGSSMTVYWRDGEFGVCSRNIDLKESDDNAFWKMAKSLNLKEKLDKYGRNIALQGELIGPGIQGNQYGLTAHEFRIFDVYDIDNGCKQLPIERSDTLFDLELDNNQVPVIGVIRITASMTIAEILLNAEGASALNGSEREGLVFKSITREFSFKAISNKWLLDNE